MVNHLGNKLSRIVRDIAYAKGDVLMQKIVAEKVMVQLKPVAAEFKTARAAIRRTEARLAELQMALGEETEPTARNARSWRHTDPGLRRGTEKSIHATTLPSRIGRFLITAYPI